MAGVATSVAPFAVILLTLLSAWGVRGGMSSFTIRSKLQETP